MPRGEQIGLIENPEVAWDIALTEQRYHIMAENAREAGRPDVSRILHKLAPLAGDKAAGSDKDLVHAVDYGESHIVRAAERMDAVVKEMSTPSDETSETTLFLFAPSRLGPSSVEDPIIVDKVNDVIAMTGADLGPKRSYDPGYTSMFRRGAEAFTRVGRSNLGPDIKLDQQLKQFVEVTASAPQTPRVR